MELRRMFILPQIDEDFLSYKFSWETVTFNGLQRVIIHNYPIPEGYNHNYVDLNLRIEANYPDVQIDMVYFFPHLTRLDNKPIKAIAIDSFDGKNWQRWSRHRSNKNPWRPGLDDISTHLTLIDYWLKKELEQE